jgi:DNA-directed RNA polymerase specialized sigma24 family protein
MSNYPTQPKKALEADLIRLEYLRTDVSDTKKRNFLFKQLANLWAPYVVARTKNLPKHEAEEVMQIYYLRVLECINSFKGTNKASFKSYLHFAAKGALDRFLTFKRVSIRGQYSLGDSLDSCTCSALNEVLLEELSTQQKGLEPEEQYITTPNRSNVHFDASTDFHDINGNSILGRL